MGRHERFIFVMSTHGVFREATKGVHFMNLRRLGWLPGEFIRFLKRNPSESSLGEQSPYLFDNAAIDHRAFIRRDQNRRRKHSVTNPITESF
jgi:hypothetical protein